MRSSSSSSICRVEWRPSRMLAAALVMLGIAAAISLALSAAPWFVALPAGLVAVAQGLQSARTELRRPPRVMVWPDAAWREHRAIFRGGLVTVSGIDQAGRCQRLHWWPDTLSGNARRRLRLASSKTSTK